MRWLESYASILLALAMSLDASRADIATDVVLEQSVVSDSVETWSQALEGKRLFFDTQARVSKVAEDSQSTHMSPEDDSRGVANFPDNKTISPLLSAGRTQATEQPFVIRYDARVQSNNSLRIVINGIPCERLDWTVQMTELAGKPVICSSLDRFGLQLFLLENGAGIQVLRGAVEVGVLFPGRSL